MRRQENIFGPIEWAYIFKILFENSNKNYSDLYKTGNFILKITNKNSFMLEKKIT